MKEVPQRSQEKSERAKQVEDGDIKVKASKGQRGTTKTSWRAKKP